MKNSRKLLSYSQSLAGSLLAARESVMSPIRPHLRNSGVTEQQWRVLRVLVDQGPRDPSNLAAAALLRAPSVTRILRELMERGLIERQVDVTDGRRSIIIISRKGRALVEETAGHTLALLEKYTAIFGKERLDALRSELLALAAALAPLGGEPEDD